MARPANVGLAIMHFDKESHVADTETAEKPAAAEKAPKPTIQLFVGPKAAREGTTYNELQKIIHAHPGKTEEELKAIVPGIWSAPNSEKFKKNPGSFLQGYFSAGVRKRFFVTSADQANQVVPEIVAGAVSDENKVVKLTRAGRDLLDTIVRADGERNSDGYVARTKVDELLGKPMTQLGKGVLKLVGDGLLEQSEEVVAATTEGGEPTKVALVRITDAGRELLAKSNEAAEPTPEAVADDNAQAEAPVAEEVAEAEEA